jgi:hypothetical protein
MDRKVARPAIVLGSERSRHFAGTVGNANTTGTVQTNGEYGTYQGSTTSSQRAAYRVYQTFLVEGDSHAYSAQEHLRLALVMAVLEIGS